MMRKNVDIYIKQVHNNYKNFKSLLLRADVRHLQTAKECFSISQRRKDIIRSYGDLLSVLEKSGELDEFHIQPLEVISEYLNDDLQRDLTNLIEIHKSLINKCNNFEIPIYNEYAKEIVDSSIETRTNVEATIINKKETSSPNKSPPTAKQNSDKKKQPDVQVSKYFEVIEFISEEIGINWKDMARYLKFRESEIDEIDYDQKFLKDKARKCLQLMFEREQTTPKTILTTALSRARRNDLSERVLLMFE